MNKSLRLFEFVCLGINCIVGAGIFSNPSQISKYVGPSSILAFLAGGAICMLIGLCFCEMSARYDGTGGAYLYTRESFGPFAGFLVGWEIWLSSLVGWASVARIFYSHWKIFSPFTFAGEDILILSLLIFSLSYLNYRGVRHGSLASNFFAITKLLPLIVFLIAGSFFARKANFTPFFQGSPLLWAPAMIAVIYTFSGFEEISLPAGEGVDAKRDLPRAIIAVLTGVTLLYVLLQTVAVGVNPGISHSSTPLVDAAKVVSPSWGAFLMGIGALLSIGGINASIALTGPRALFALAEGGFLPPMLRKIHPLFHTPSYAILINSSIVFFLAITGTFESLLKLSVLASIWQYTPTCLAVLKSKIRGKDYSRTILPGGAIIPILSLIACAALIFSIEAQYILWNIAGLMIGLPFYIIYGKKKVRL